MPLLWLRISLLMLLLLSCDSGDHLYCSRYQYLYNQLLEHDAPQVRVLRQAIERARKDPGADQHELDFMEQVLNDFTAGVKPKGMAPQAFCLQERRYQAS